MQALTIWQPWATLIAVGAKQFETRDWRTDHRGGLAIHAGKRWEEDQIRLCYEEPFRTVLKQAGFENAKELPRGAVVARCELQDIRKTERLDRELIGPYESEFGDFSPGRYAWRLTVKERCDPPKPASGKPGLWRWTP